MRVKLSDKIFSDSTHHNVITPGIFELMLWGAHSHFNILPQVKYADGTFLTSTSIVLSQLPPMKGAYFLYPSTIRYLFRKGILKPIK
jgi:hypothetical protein